MLNFLPVGLIFFTLLLLQILARGKRTIGSLWLLLAVAVILVWGSLLAMYSFLPQPLKINNWFSIDGTSLEIVFHFGKKAWLYSFALITSLIGVVFVDATRLHQKKTITDWIEILLLTSIGLLSVLSASALAFILTWTLIDLVEMFIWAKVVSEESITKEAIIGFGWRFLGTFLVVAALVLGNLDGSTFSLDTVSGVSLLFCILGSILRSGILPFKLPYSYETGFQRSLGAFLRILAPLSSIIFLSNLAVPEKITGWLGFIFIGCLVAVVFGSIKVLSSKNEISARPYWVLSFFCFAVISYLRGYVDGALYWGFLMAVIGTWVLVYSYRPGKMNYLLWIIPAGMIGLPFTPSLPAIEGISTKPFPVVNLLLWLSLALLIASVIKFGIRQAQKTELLENWVRLFFVVGQVILTIAPFLISIWEYRKFANLQYLWVTFIIVIFLTGVLVILLSNKVKDAILSSRVSVLVEESASLEKVFSSFLRLNWLNNIFTAIGEFLKQIINGFNRVLEGEAGILWALVFLAILVSLLISRSIG